MKVFVVNCGSSSIKYQLFDMTDESVLAKGQVERVGSNEAELHQQLNGQKYSRGIPAENHTQGIRYILEALVDPEIGVIRKVEEIDAVGHRVVHGGEKITRATLIDAAVMDVVRENFILSPVHNPPNLAGIEAAMQAMPGVPNVAVFDTAFLASLPPHAYRYAVPDDWYTKHHVRRYGFHGTSHHYVTLRMAEILQKPLSEVNLITVHLGNGCSMTAVAGGKAVDHSMGMTPLEGLVMGTRSGDIDPAIVFYMISNGLSPEDVDRALNKESGLLGLSRHSNDMRDCLEAAAAGNANAQLAVDVFIYRAIKYIGSYYAILPGLDAIVLTGGIGENSLPVRKGICDGLGVFGTRCDDDRNETTIRGQEGPLSTDQSRIPVWCVPTNEELMIARDTCQVVG